MRKNSGKQTKSVPTSFDLAPEVEEIAKRLIPKYHAHLINSEIAFAFVNKEMKHQGKMVIGKAEKISKKMKVLTNKEFMITMSSPIWQNLSDKQKEAVVDHELMHCFTEDDEKTGEKRNVMLNHDFADFNQVIIRHGMYMGDLELLEKAVEQVHSKEGKKVVLEKKAPVEEKVEQKQEAADEEDDDSLFADEPPKMQEKPAKSTHTYIPLLTKPVDPDDDDPLVDPDPPKEPEDTVLMDEEESDQEDESPKPKKKQKKIIVTMEKSAKTVKGYADDNDLDFG